MCFGDTTKQTHQFDALAEAFGLDKQLLDSYFVQHLSATPESASTTPATNSSNSSLGSSYAQLQPQLQSQTQTQSQSQQQTLAQPYSSDLGLGYDFGYGFGETPLFPHDPFSGLDLSGIPLMDPDTFFDSSPATSFFLPPSAFTLPACGTEPATATATATERRATQPHSGAISKKGSHSRHSMKREVAEWLEQHPEPLGVAKCEDEETATNTATNTATEDALRLRRRLRNRTSAQQSRARRRAHRQQLEEEAARLIDLGGTLRSQLVVLETENRLLAAQLAELHSVVALAARIGHMQPQPQPQPHIQFAIPSATACLPLAPAHAHHPHHSPAAALDWLLQPASY